MTSTGGLLNKLFGLEGQVAVVTGGAGRIGSAVAAGLAAAGAKVCILEIADEAAAQLATRIAADTGRQVIAVKADTTSRESLEAALQDITARLGTPSILVNSTQFRGKGFYSSDVSAYPLEAWNSVLEVNLTGVFLACQVFGRAMPAGGRIVNLAFDLRSGVGRSTDLRRLRRQFARFLRGLQSRRNQPVPLPGDPLARETDPSELPGSRRRLRSAGRGFCAGVLRTYAAGPNGRGGRLCRRGVVHGFARLGLHDRRRGDR